MLVNAMKSYSRANDVNNKDCALEGPSCQGPPNKNSTLPLGVDCNSHQPNKENYSILRPNTHTTCQHIEKSLGFAKRGMDHTTFVLEIDCLTSKWHIGRLSLNSTKHIVQCMLLQGCCAMPKSGLPKMAQLLQPTKGSRRNYTPPRMWSMIFQFCYDDIKCYTIIRGRCNSIYTYFVSRNSTTHYCGIIHTKEKKKEKLKIK